MSALAPGKIDRLHLQAVAALESVLRKGQINDSLEGLRLALGQKSLCFRTDVRNADSQHTTLCAWDNIHKYDAEARIHRKTYQHARSALERLSTDPEFLATLQNITEDDIKVSGDITEENRFGQRSDTLPWFWHLGTNPASDDESSPQMQECEYHSLCVINANLWIVYRVSWLRAKARYLRWEEEVRLIKLEMTWTVKWFRHQEERWNMRLDANGGGGRDEGLNCYCNKQIVLWKALGDDTEHIFNSLVGPSLFS
jgi:hypothetical protein